MSHIDGAFLLIAGLLFAALLCVTIDDWSDDALDE
jgi:hypothetical protein